KVLLTVSPFRPSFSPQLNLYALTSRAVSPLSTAFTSNRSLTRLSTAFTQNTRGRGYLCDTSASLRLCVIICCQFCHPLFSRTYELLFPQLFCFHNHLRCPLVFSSRCIFQRRTHKTLPCVTT